LSGPDPSVPLLHDPLTIPTDNTAFSLELREREKADLVEFLKRL
jgi:hypothetical protein